MKGVEATSEGVNIELEGDFNEIGTVFVSEKASANILSFAAQVDSGATVEYDQLNDRFLMTPANSDNTYSFCRKNIAGTEGRFYCCDVRSMINKRSRAPPATKEVAGVREQAMVQTVQENLAKYTKREIDKARNARDLLARMGFPSVENAIKMVHRGANFSVTERDFRIADSIWGKDVASIKGKTKKQTTGQADTTLVNLSSRKLQVLSIDIMYIERIPILVGVAHPLDFRGSHQWRTRSRWFIVERTSA